MEAITEPAEHHAPYPYGHPRAASGLASMAGEQAAALGLRAPFLIRALAGLTATFIILALSVPILGHAAPPGNPPSQQEPLNAGEVTPGLERSVTKALSYQTIVVATDQLLYWWIITGTPASELGFLTANAVTGVAYYIGFDQVWGTARPGSPAEGVSVTKAIAYRVFDTARVLGVTLAIGTPITDSVAVTAAIAATRTGIYMLHDYAWTAADNPGPQPASARQHVTATKQE